MKKWLPAVLGVAVGVSACYGVLQLMGGTAVAQQHLFVDHYKCYSIWPEQTEKFAPPLRLKDQFEAEELKHVRSKFICAPVSKEGSPIVSPEIHLKMYQIVEARAFPKNERPHVKLHSLNEHFQDEEVDVVKPSFLLVPTLKSRVR
jgi:hypothetical protein